MTRRPGPGGPGGPPARPKPRAGDPYGIGQAGAFLAPALSVLGLVLVAWVTMGLFTGRLPSVGGPNRSGGVIAHQTHTPSNVVIVPPDQSIKGSIVFAKEGNLWTWSGTKATQITTTGRDSQPSFSPDGNWIYFIETRTDYGPYLFLGSRINYELDYPVLSRIHPDGSGREKVLNSLLRISGGRYEWFYWIRQPVISPDGHTIAVISDGPDPINNDVVLQTYDLTTKRLKPVQVSEYQPFGHQDPAWSPDGHTLAYTKNGRDGTRGAPQVFRYDTKSAKFRAVTGPGYMSPAWSPDGAYIAATKTSTLGTDIAILDARTGNELIRLTSDQHAWGAAWSPAGDAIAFLHITGQVVDLEMIKLSGTPGQWTASNPIPLTVAGGLDGASHPDWYIAPGDLPVPTAAPVVSPSPSGP